MLTGLVGVNERRSSKRWHTVLEGNIELTQGAETTACIVRDLSDTGARLYVTNAVQLPPDFELEIPSRRLRVRSRLVWSRGANYGVMFLERVTAWSDPLRGAAA